MSADDRERGSWRWDAETGELVQAATAEELEARRAERAAAVDRTLAAARDSFRRDRDASRGAARG